MENSEAYRIIGERAELMAKDSKIQTKMMEMIKKGKTKDEVKHWLYICAIGTLIA